MLASSSSSFLHLPERGIHKEGGSGAVDAVSATQRRHHQERSPDRLRRLPLPTSSGDNDAGPLGRRTGCPPGTRLLVSPPRAQSSLPPPHRGSSVAFSQVCVWVGGWGGGRGGREGREGGWWCGRTGRGGGEGRGVGGPVWCVWCVVLCHCFTVSLFFNACDVTTKLAPDAPSPRRNKTQGVG